MIRLRALAIRDEGSQPLRLRIQASPADFAELTKEAGRIFRLELEDYTPADQAGHVRLEPDRGLAHFVSLETRPPTPNPGDLKTMNRQETAETAARDLELVRELRGEICRCGQPKASRQTFCRDCYYALPRHLRNDLYKPLGSGYAEAYQAAAEELDASGRPPASIVAPEARP